MVSDIIIISYQRKVLDIQRGLIKFLGKVLPLQTCKDLISISCQNSLGVGLPVIALLLRQ